MPFEDDCAATGEAGELDFEVEKYNEKCGVFGCFVRIHPSLDCLLLVHASGG